MKVQEPWILKNILFNPVQLAESAAFHRCGKSTGNSVVRSGELMLLEAMVGTHCMSCRRIGHLHG